VLYQLSYIGENQPLAISLQQKLCIRLSPQLFCIATTIRAQHIFPAYPRIRWSLIVFQDKIPKATNAASATIKRFTRSLAPLGIPAAAPASANLVHREGFEPSYLARRDRFTVCWL
jgi:hypothetical protein